MRFLFLIIAAALVGQSVQAQDTTPGAAPFDFSRKPDLLLVRPEAGQDISSRDLGSGPGGDLGTLIARLTEVGLVQKIDPEFPIAIIPDLDAAIERLNRSGLLKDGALVDLSDGRRLVVRRRGDSFMVVRGGGAVGGIPGMQPGLVPNLEVTRVLPIDLVPQLSTGSEVPGLGSGAASNRNRVESEPSCGAETSEPSTHCALSTVRLRHTTLGTFCTGVVISDEHVLTAAHCLCDMRNGENLRAEVFATFGSGNRQVSMSFVEEPPQFFTEIEGGACVTGVTLPEAYDNGDLAIIRLALPSSGAQGATPVEHAKQSLLGEGADPAQADKMIALLGRSDASTWSTGGSPVNLFATWGYGEGPNRMAGVKRGLDYRLDSLLPCSDGTAGASCGSLQEAIFFDAANGLCAGDSGSGLFKAVDETIPSGYGRWALMGIASGYRYPSDCFDPYGQVLLTHWPRNVVRIDTPQIVTWLTAATGGKARWADTRMDYDVNFADLR